MKKVRIVANIDNYLHKTPLKVKTDLYKLFGGMEDFIEEVIFTLQNTIINNILDLKSVDHWLYNHAYETIDAMYDHPNDISPEHVEWLANGFKNMCFDLHDAVLPNIVIRGVDVTEIRVSVDDVDTFGEHNGAVTDEIAMYLTCVLRDNQDGDEDNPYVSVRGVHSPIVTDAHHNDTTFELDDTNLYDWAPVKLHPFVRNMMVGIIVRFMKVGMERPHVLRSRDSVGAYTIINQSICEQVDILEDEFETMDDHSYNQDIVDTYYNYEDELKHCPDSMSHLITVIGSYLSVFFYNPSELRDRIWSNIQDFKNVTVFRNNNSVTFRLIHR